MGLLEKNKKIRKFRSLSISKRYNELRREGSYVGSRNLSAHFVHLFTYRDFYVEIWVILGINKIHWIEVQQNQNILAEYTEKVDISSLF